MPKKPRKREYLPPTHEVVNKKETAPRMRRSRPSSGGRGGGQWRLPPEPSLRRTLRRLPIYFLILFALQFFLMGDQAEKDNLSPAQRAFYASVTAGMVTLAFAPFMYWMERWSYRMQKRRYERDHGTGGDG